eukprot:TRINITY_DN69_c0_g1_i4.p1 TRINITY_DN69_c0_g1~~TRINITY_DN69_c0_g1_i4.p1  ORF type:complete len:207 (+),score=42.73 TRINITY_DN69_c0_g1_i4:137-757(+)
MFARTARLFARAAPMMRTRAAAASASTVTMAGAAAWATAIPSVSCDSIPAHGLPGTKCERTFIAVKPDGVQRALVGDIIARFEKRGYKLVALKMTTPTKKFAEQHYADLSSKKFFGGLTDFFSSGPVVAMIWEGEDVIRYGRVILGATMPGDSAPGTVRGDYAVNVGRNVCHGSDSPEGAQAEIALWWSEAEINNWSKSADANIYE